MPIASVIVPAHDEEAVIGRCLDALRVGVPADAFETVVVCNGCCDGTADIARRRGFKVIETVEASKPAALDLGDGEATVFPRFYLDADIEVTGAALAAVARMLREGEALAAAPRLSLDLRGASIASRAYHAIWIRLPYVQQGHVGSGVVGLSAEGRRRFECFPDAIADDLFLYHRFAPCERRMVEEVSSTVRPPRTACELVRRKSRVYAGNTQMRTLGLAPAREPRLRQAGWIRVVATHPWLLPAAPVYVVLSAAAKLRARRKLRSGDLLTWERDESSRGLAGEPG